MLNIFRSKLVKVIKSKTTLIAFVSLLATLIIATYIFYAVSSDSFGAPTPTGFGNFGAYIGGTAGALFGIISAFLLYSTYKTQSEQLALTKQEVEFGIAKGYITPIKDRVDENFATPIAQYGESPQENRTKRNEKSPPRALIISTQSLIPRITTLLSYTENKSNHTVDKRPGDYFLSGISNTIAGVSLANEVDVSQGISTFFSTLYKDVIGIFDVTLRLHDEIKIPPLYLSEYINWLENVIPTLEEIYREASDKNTDASYMTDYLNRLCAAKKEMKRLKSA